MLFMADRAITIKESDENACTIADLEKLDEMLNAHKINHFFSIPMGDENGIAIDQNDAAILYYEEENEMTVDLIYALWAKTCRGADDKKIAKCLERIADRFA
ncbi:MAG: hypothetical protein IKU30_04870 [Clostridia bacterium]|nr:hypothetical protein [Clostridia bacterium]